MPEPKPINRIPTPQEIELTAEGASAAARARAAIQAGSGVKGAAKAAQGAKAFSRAMLPVALAADAGQTAYNGFNNSADEQLKRVEEAPERVAIEGFLNPTSTLYSAGRAAVTQAEQAAAPFVDEQRKRMQEHRAKLRRFAATTRIPAQSPQPVRYSVLPVPQRPVALDPYASTSPQQ